MKKKSQAEMFGIALFFVVIIFGIIIFTNITNLNRIREKDKFKIKEYEILANDLSNALVASSVDCDIKENTFLEVVEKCVTTKDILTCGGIPISSCDKAVKHLNNTLFYLLNNTIEDKGLTNIPFYLEMEEVENKNSKLNVNITNFGQYNYKGKIINRSNYRKYNFQRQTPEGPIIIKEGGSTVKIYFELYLI